MKCHQMLFASWLLNKSTSNECWLRRNLGFQMPPIRHQCFQWYPAPENKHRSVRHTGDGVGGGNCENKCLHYRRPRWSLSSGITSNSYHLWFAYYHSNFKQILKNSPKPGKAQLEASEWKENKPSMGPNILESTFHHGRSIWCPFTHQQYC